MTADLNNILKANTNKVQSFDDTPIDLSVYKGMFDRYVDIIKDDTKTKTYGDMDLRGAVESTVSNPVYHEKLTEEEQKDSLQNVVFDFQETAKEQLRSEFPVIDQLILEEKLRKEE